jgi:WD40 repeat protein
VLSLDKSQLAALGLGVTVWSKGESLPSKDFSVHKGTITSLPQCIAFSSNGESLAIGSSKEVRVWNTKNWSPTHYFGGHTYEVRAIGFMEDRHLIVVPAAGNSKIYTLATSQLNQTDPIAADIKAIALTSTGKQILSLSSYGISCRDSASGKLIFTLPKDEFPFEAETMVVSNGTQHLLIFGKNAAVLWDLETKEKIHSFQSDVIRAQVFFQWSRLQSLGRIVSKSTTLMKEHVSLAWKML